jgi:hypothetical protein
MGLPKAMVCSGSFAKASRDTGLPRKGGVEVDAKLRWLPRHLDIDRTSDPETQEIVLTTNLTPRKCLGFNTPFQALLAELGKDVQIRASLDFVALRSGIQGLRFSVCLTGAGNQSKWLPGPRSAMGLSATAVSSQTKASYPDGAHGLVDLRSNRTRGALEVAFVLQH